MNVAHASRASTQPLRVFISTAAEQDALAAQLTAAFEARGWEVWRHRHRSKSAAYRATTLLAIEQAQVVVVLWSDTSSVSPWVIDEADAGMKKGTAVAVELGGATGPLGFAGAVRVRLASAAAGLSKAQLQAIWEAVLDAADVAGLLGARHIWLDRSAAASALNLLLNVGAFGLLALAAALARWPGFLLGSTGAILCAALAAGSVAGGYALDWTAQRFGALARSYRRRLLWRWAGEALGGGSGGFIGDLVLSGVRGHELSAALVDALPIMLGGMSVVTLLLLAPKFVSLLLSKALQRRLLGRPG